MKVRKHCKKGFTLIEMLIVISIVGVLAGILFSRVLFYQELAEKASMQQVVSALQTALVLEYGHRLANNMGAEVNKLGLQNPMNFLSQKPANYAGEFSSFNPAAIEPGYWAYDRSAHELIYLPYHTRHFLSANATVKWIRYCVSISYEASMKGKGVNPVAVLLTPAESYQWLIREND